MTGYLDDEDLAPELRAGVDEADRNSKRGNGKGTPAPLGTVSAASWEGLPVPKRRWHIAGAMPHGTVTSLYGDGGTGKSLLAQQLMTSTVLGLPWLGFEVEQCPAVGIFCEDIIDELHRRQADINIAMRCEMRDLGQLHYLSRVGEDSLLMTFERGGIGKLTDFFNSLVDTAKGVRAGLLVVDTAADTFGGNENDRPQVRQFINACLGKAARIIGGSTLLCAHPSSAGITQGTGSGGSTGWSNSVRARMYLRRDKPEGDIPADERVRFLELKKANYSELGDEIKLRWGAGVFGRDARADQDGIFGTINRRAVDTVFLEILDRLTATGVSVSQSSKAGNYAPKVFAQQPDRDGHNADEFQSAMWRLLGKKLELESYGRKGDLRSRIIRKPE